MWDNPPFQALIFLVGTFFIMPRLNHSYIDWKVEIGGSVVRGFYQAFIIVCAGVFVSGIVDLALIFIHFFLEFPYESLYFGLFAPMV